MKNVILFLLAIVLVSCTSTSNKKQVVTEEIKADYKLELLWESDTTVRTPESVLLDRQRDILYVSCINEGPWEKDGNGFISKMDKKGNVVELKWIEGLSAPKGMGISGNSLFIADIDELIEADINTGEIKNRIVVDGSPQLNDITTGGNGEVYVSGSGSQKIYKLEDGALKAIFEGEEGERFNGLYWEKERMLLITSASSQFKEIPWVSMEAKVISENMGHGDAICPVGDGGYLTTSWKGAVFYVSADGEVTELLNTEAKEENAADADFCIDEQILYLPTFFKNKVKAYKLVK
jgi:outer membrane protein assembly factor BamB